MMRLLALLAALLLIGPASADIVFYYPGGAGGAGGFVAATAGQSTVTGTTAETNLAALRIPANTIGRNGHVDVYALWTYTNSANTKNFTVRFAAAAGVTGSIINNSATATGTTTIQTLAQFQSNNSLTQQSAFSIGTGITAPYALSGVPVSFPGQNTAADTYINLTAQLAVAGDSITLVHAVAAVYPAP